MMTGKITKLFSALLLGSGIAVADDTQYPFITDGAIHDIVGDSTEISSASSLDGGQTSDVSDAEALEARYRTWDKSEGLMLRTDKLPFVIVVR